MSLPEQVDSTTEILRASGFLSAIVALVHGWRRGTVPRLWDAFIGFLAAPVERDLARREARNLRADNSRLSLENDFLRGELYKEPRADGSYRNEDGTPTLHSSSLIWATGLTGPPSLTSLHGHAPVGSTATMFEGWETKDYSHIQAAALGTMGLTLMLFGLAVYAQQYRRGVRPTWPLPGGLVGGTFLIAVGLLPMMMTLVRLHILNWTATAWQQTVVYYLIAICSMATMLRWWRKGLDDDYPWDGYSERRSGRDRRKELK